MDTADDGEIYTYVALNLHVLNAYICLLYTSDAADDLLCVDLGGRRIIKKKRKITRTLTCKYIAIHTQTEDITAINM